MTFQWLRNLELYQEEDFAATGFGPFGGSGLCEGRAAFGR